MFPKLITYDDAIDRLSWAEAVDALRAGHLRPKAQVDDMFLGPADATLLSRGAFIDGLGFHIPKDYIYAAMGFSVFVEGLNLRARRRRQAPIELRPTFVKEEADEMSTGG
jgi:hypothetical protein